MSSFKDWAKWYVTAHGLAVFPLPPNKKEAGRIGIKSASRDLAQIEAWWDAEPYANIAVLGCVRVDIDPKREGTASWNMLVAQNGEPQTLTANTPSGGKHLYFRSEAKLGNGTGLLPPGIDIRGQESGYTVAPPSHTTASSTSRAGVYTFVDAGAPIADIPPWLLDLIQGNRREVSAPTENRTEIDAEQLADLRAALLSPQILNDWARWSDTGYALLSIGETGQRLFEEFSALQAALHHDKEVIDSAETWWGRHANSEPKSDYRSIFARAQAAGWKNPKATDMTKLGLGVVAGAAAPPPPQKFHARSGWDFAEGASAAWRVKDIFHERGVVQVFGPPGSGKTFLVFDMVMAISRGTPYGANKHDVAQCNTAYIAAEGAFGLKHRFRAYRQHHGLTNDCPVPFVIPVAPNLSDRNDVVALGEELVRVGARVAAIDTLHASMTGLDENSAKDMGVVLNHARLLSDTIQGLVIIIHHTGKDESRGARGSTSISGAMETELQVSNDAGIRTVRFFKQRDGRDDITLNFRLLPVDVPSPDGVVSAAVLEHCGQESVPVHRVTARASSEGVRGPSRMQKLTVDMLKSMTPVYGDSVQMEVLIQSILTQRPDQRADSVRRSLTRMIDRGVLSIDSGGNLRAIAEEDKPEGL